jgi:alkaline phosphatase D
MPISRRDVLRGAGSLGLSTLVPSLGAALGPSLAGCSASDDDPGPADQPAGLQGPSPADPASKAAFAHGVASGDPLPGAVILWTRVTTTSGAAVAVSWQIARDRDMRDLVGSGEVSTDASRDFTVKVDATGLEPGKTYYYRFLAEGGSSPIGRTRTAPAGGVDRLRFAVVSCARYAHGYFHAYRGIAARLDLDAVLHLGDYIYEYGTGDYGSARPYEPAHEILTLADYRTRHGYYRRDPDLQAVHQQHPFIAIWDDHEVADNGYDQGAENHQPDEGSWADRKAAATQAYREWMPIRDSESGVIYRTLRYGDLADLVLLDTRYGGRVKQLPTDDPGLADKSRSILGATQEAWVAEELKGSKATWRLVGQQVVMTQLPSLFASDAWEGYPGSRERLFAVLTENKIDNVVVLTGDIHSSWANDLAPDVKDPAAYDPATGAGAIAVEFVTPAVSAPGATEAVAPAAAALVTENKGVKFVDFYHRGYIVLDVTPARVQAAWFHYATPEEPEVPTTFARAFSTMSGQNRLREEAEPAPPRDDAPAAAPTF